MPRFDGDVPRRRLGRGRWRTAAVLAIVLAFLASPGPALAAAECKYRLQEALESLETSSGAMRSLFREVIEYNEQLDELRDSAMSSENLLGCSAKLAEQLTTFSDAMQSADFDRVEAEAETLLACGDHFAERIKVDVAAAQAAGDSEKVIRLSRIRGMITRLVSGSTSLAQSSQSLVFKGRRLRDEAESLRGNCAETDSLGGY